MTVPSAGRWRYALVRLMGPNKNLSMLSSGAQAALTLWSVSNMSLELCPSQSQLVGIVWRTGETLTPFLQPLCLSLSVCEGESTRTGLNDSAVPGRAKGGEKKRPPGPNSPPFRRFSLFVFEQTLGQPIRAEASGLSLPWLTATLGSWPVKQGVGGGGGKVHGWGAG